MGFNGLLNFAHIGRYNVDPGGLGLFRGLMVYGLRGIFNCRLQRASECFDLAVFSVNCTWNENFMFQYNFVQLSKKILNV